MKPLKNWVKKGRGSTNIIAISRCFIRNKLAVKSSEKLRDTLEILEILLEIVALTGEELLRGS